MEVIFLVICGLGLAACLTFSIQDGKVLATGEGEGSSCGLRAAGALLTLAAVVIFVLMSMSV